MFDYVYVEYPLPEGYEQCQDADFQTKDLQNFMVEYHITAEGKLVERKFDYRDMTPEEVEKEKQFFANLAIKGKNGILDMGFEPHQIRADTYTDVDTEYHGDLHFYEWDRDKKEMIDFVARFTNGSLEWIKPISEEELGITRYNI